MATLVDPTQISGRQKAAILCMALGAEVAAKVTQQLTPEEAEVISYEIARADQVSPERLDLVLSEWVESVVAVDVAGGGVEFAREVRDFLEHSLGVEGLARSVVSVATGDQAALVRVASEQQLAAAHGTARPVGELRQLAFVLDQLDARIAAAEGVAAERDAEVAHGQLALTAAFRERRVLDGLKERHLDARRTEAVQLDRQMMDAIALSRFPKRER